MLNRRHLRVKVMQTIYGMGSKEQVVLATEQKFLNESIKQGYDLYLLMLDIMVEIHAFAKASLETNAKKILATSEDINPNTRFIDNAVLQKIATNEELQNELDRRKLRNWRLDSEYVSLLHKEMIESEFYKAYMEADETTFKKDKSFLKKLYSEVIAPNDKLYDYFEDKRLTWLDDYALVNMTVIKRLDKLKPSSPEATLLPNLFKSEDDEQFSIDLLECTVANDEYLTDQIVANTPNWDKERIADVDMVLIKMALCEFLKFPSIPVKVTINEYLEIAKEYSTPKSSIFINGILDKMVKQYKSDNTLKKDARGLQE